MKWITQTLLTKGQAASRAKPNVRDVIFVGRSFEWRSAMRTIIGNILKTAVAVALVSALMSVEAVACPQGYFQCGPVCCPHR